MWESSEESGSFYWEMTVFWCSDSTLTRMLSGWWQEETCPLGNEDSRVIFPPCYFSVTSSSKQSIHGIFREGCSVCRWQHGSQQEAWCFLWQGQLDCISEIPRVFLRLQDQVFLAYVLRGRSSSCFDARTVCVSCLGFHLFPR